jgi:hypothetical protein
LIRVIGISIDTSLQKPRYIDFNSGLAFIAPLHYPYVHVLA